MSMKFCKDCTNYSPAIVTLKCYCPASCMAGKGKAVFDPVTGDERCYAGNPHQLRAAGGECGPDGAWFVPANLDGRLAMLEGQGEAK